MDRRKFPRVPAAHLVYIGPQKAWQPADGVLTKTLDLSITGFAVELPHDLPVGCTYTAVLSLHDEIVSLPAQAVRCAPLDEETWEIAFQFRNLSQRYFRLLSRSFADIMV